MYFGMFYAEPTDITKLAFSGDVNNVVSAHRYKVFAPNSGSAPSDRERHGAPVLRSHLGMLRTMECGLSSTGGITDIPVDISMRDFMGSRTAMFGKTQLGKSNVVKLIAKGMLEATRRRITSVS